MVSIIVAHDKNRAIGKNGEMPWPKIAIDLKRFRNITLGNEVIMGWNTFASLGYKALPNRLNMVVTKNHIKELLNPYICKTDTPCGYIQNAGEFEGSNLFVIGGAKLFEIALPYCKQLFVTEIEAEFEDCDTFMPNYSKFVENAICYRQDNIFDEGSGLYCNFVKYVL